MIAFVNHCTTVCKGNRKKEEGSKVDLHFFPMQFLQLTDLVRRQKKAPLYMQVKTQSNIA